LLKVTKQLIGNNRGSTDGLSKGGSCLLCLRKEAGFLLKEKSAGTISVYKQKRLADLSSSGVKSADMGRNVKGTVLQG
jgi:hypothetical protein